MGLETVAVYSEADAEAPHVREAGQAVLIGPAPAAESYLRMDAILDACRRTGADAVHPGYGFLSENADFAEALEASDITFIGPPASAIRAMGLKDAAKALMKIAGVPIVPGYQGDDQSLARLERSAKAIGYPLLIKAVAGGGGKGMRRVDDPAEFGEALIAAQREASRAFGNDGVLIEKYLTKPRHIEVQVFADGHGNVVHLFERDCSLQRRHQKVIEEAPAPGMPPAMREAMGEAAVKAAKAIQYRGAGTVEFIVDASVPLGEAPFYFMEMNTRLQVEHPVTELITGLDLVEQMIRVAAGERLAFTQADVKLSGWAVETRVYAEDPYRGFLPSIGRLTTYSPPSDDIFEPAATDPQGIRVDTGVVEGSEISMFYDPMIAKLVTHGATREQAIDRQIEALDRYAIKGIGHNIDFLSAVMQHPRFREGRLTTGFIAEEYPDGFAGAAVSDETRHRLVASAAAIHAIVAERESLIDGQLSGHGAHWGEDWVVLLDKQSEPVRVVETGDAFQIYHGDRVHNVSTGWSPGVALFEAEIDGADVAFAVERRPVGYRLTGRGGSHDIRVLSPRAAALSQHMIEKIPPDLSKFLLCPMPGLVVAVNVAEGDKVEAGQPLATVEAMKMENILRAEKSATVKAVRAKAGESLAVDAVILEFE